MLNITLEDLERVDPNISVIFKRKKLKEIHSLIKSKFVSVEKFSKIIGFNPATLFTWLNGQRNTKLKTVRKICELLGFKLEDVVEKVICFNEPFGSFILLNAFPIKGDPHLASLVAHSFGDGHISISFEFTNRCEELLNEVNSNVKNLPIKNVKVIVNQQPNKAPTLFFPKMVRNVLICAGAPIGNKITSNFDFPKWIKDGNKKIKSAFMRAFFDDEGSVSRDGVIRISLSKRKDLADNLRLFFKEIKLVLEDLGIKRINLTEQKGEIGKNGETLENTLVICGLFKCKIFSEIIGFNHPKKMNRLLTQLENIKVFRTGKGETKEKIVDILGINPLTIDELSKRLKLSFSTIHEHLKDLESRDLITRNKNNSRKSIWSISSQNIL